MDDGEWEEDTTYIEEHKKCPEMRESSLQTEMNELPSNFGIQTKCIAGCNTVLTNEHIFF